MEIPDKDLYLPRLQFARFGYQVLGFGSSTAGGTEYTVHSFTSDGELDVSSGGVIDFLVVGGGGGGGDAASNGAGGGGAGGMISSALTSTVDDDGVSHGPWTIAAGVYTIQVGAGGAGGASNNAGGSGGNGSYIKGKAGETFTNYICAVYGGGGGGASSGGSSGSSFGGGNGHAGGGNGGSTGGASQSSSASYGGSYLIIANDHGRDVADASAGWSGDYYDFSESESGRTDSGWFGGGSDSGGTVGAGGGGAGGRGEKGESGGGDGGAPRANSFRTGVPVYYSAGGPGVSGGDWHANAYGTGGLTTSGNYGAVANSGYGGRANASSVAAGGSGIVVIRYITGAVSATGGTVTTYSA